MDNEKSAEIMQEKPSRIKQLLSEYKIAVFLSWCYNGNKNYKAALKCIQQFVLIEKVEMKK